MALAGDGPAFRRLSAAVAEARLGRAGAGVWLARAEALRRSPEPG